MFIFGFSKTPMTVKKRMRIRTAMKINLLLTSISFFAKASVNGLYTAQEDAPSK